MKTPRELLLERHQSIEPRLDAIRSAMGVRGRAVHGTGIRPSLIGMLLSLRWHLAGISAAWLLIALVNREAGDGRQVVTKQMSPASAQRLATLRENRRQIAELLDSGAEPAGPVFVPKRRSECNPPILIA